MFNTKSKQTFNLGRKQTTGNLNILPSWRRTLKSACSGWSHSGHSRSRQRHSRHRRRTWHRKSACLSHTRCANVQPKRGTKQQSEPHELRRHSKKLHISQGHWEKLLSYLNTVGFWGHRQVPNSHKRVFSSRQELRQTIINITKVGQGLFWI